MFGIKNLKYKELLITAFLFFGVQTSLQWVNGAFISEFGGHSDEAAHYVTGLMVHDYVAALRQAQDPDPPMKFAKEYYIHYPKVAMGHWPPFFYVVQTAWTLLFSPSRISMILLMAFLTTLLSDSIFGYRGLPSRKNWRNRPFVAYGGRFCQPRSFFRL